MRALTIIFAVVAMAGWVLYFGRVPTPVESVRPREDGVLPPGEVREIPPLLEIEEAMRGAEKHATSEYVRSGEEAARFRIEQLMSTWLAQDTPRELHIRGWRVWLESASARPEPEANIIASLDTLIGHRFVFWTLRGEREMGKQRVNAAMKSSGGG